MEFIELIDKSVWYEEIKQKSKQQLAHSEFV